MAKLLVTGGSGHLGKRVLELLLETTKPSDIITTSRSPEKLSSLQLDVRKSSFDDNVDEQAKAFKGADHLLIISTDGIGRRIEQHTKAIQAAKQAGVEHISYTSLAKTDPGNPITIAPEHWATEQALAKSGLAYTALRNNWYAEYLIPSLQSAVKTGQLFSATKNQPFGAITRDDCARAAAAALKQGGTQKRTLEISGPEGVTHDQLAAIVSELTGKRVEHVNVSADDYEKALTSHGVPAEMAHLVRTFHDAIAQGLGNPRSDTQALISAAPTSMALYLSQARAALSA